MIPKSAQEPPERRPRIYGLTGGIGSGKSEAAKCFARRGIAVLDADAIGHEVLAPGGAAEGPVIAAFGPGIVRYGRIDRRALAEIVFSDEGRRGELNGITHPLIGDEIRRRARELAGQGQDVVLVEAALWGEKGALEPWMDGLILVTCPEDERLRRLVERRGMSRPDAQARLAAQSPPGAKHSLASWVLSNEGSLDALQKAVDAIVEELHGRAC